MLSFIRLNIRYAWLNDVEDLLWPDLIVAQQLGGFLYQRVATILTDKRSLYKGRVLGGDQMYGIDKPKLRHL